MAKDTKTPEQLRTVIAYYERVLEQTRCPDRRFRAERRIKRLRRQLETTPKQPAKEDCVMAGRYGTETYSSVHDVREHARRCALAGKPVFVNPYIGEDAEVWFAAYRDVPEAERGSQPQLLPTPMRRRGQGRPRHGMAEAGVNALGERTLPGSTPLLSRSAAGRMGKRVFDEQVKAGIAEAEARTPKPWAIDGVGL